MSIGRNTIKYTAPRNTYGNTVKFYPVGTIIFRLSITFAFAFESKVRPSVTFHCSFMESFFPTVEDTSGHTKIGSKRGLKKPDRPHFWTGFLTLIGGTLGTNPRFKCMTCTHEFAGVSRAAVHLKAADDDKSVQLCPNVSEENSADCRRLYEAASKKKQKQTQHVTSAPGPTMAKKYITGPLKAAADTLFARFVFMCMLPFRIVEKVWFKEFISNGLFVLHTFPDRKRLSGELLDREYELVQDKVDKMLALLDYVQLSSDGWSNIRGEAIISYVTTCSKGDYYIDSTDASLVEKKGADWCFEDFKRIVAKAKIPFAKINGLVTDTEPKMRALWKLVEKDYPTIFAYGCCTHTIQLILKDICALPWFATVCAKCDLACTKITNKNRTPKAQGDLGGNTKNYQN